MTWNDHFLELFDRCVKRYKNGDKDFTGYYDDEDMALLLSMGYRKREFFAVLTGSGSELISMEGNSSS